MQDQRIPVTVLTGYLGSGKTTLLGRVLREQHGHRIAVIENEFGEAPIDNELLVRDRDEQIVVMNNGCICCTVRGDLVRILGDLAQRRREGSLDFERVMIETTGLAAPAPVAQTFFMNLDIARDYLLDAIVTLVDAVHAPAQLDARAQAREQVAFADRLLISKCDLADASALVQLKRRLTRLNPRAQRHRVQFGEIDLREILDIRAFSIDAALEIAPDFLEDGDHAHDEDIASFVLREARAFDPVRLDAFMRMLTQQYGGDMLRYKGILNVQGRDSRVLLQGVHMVMGALDGREWEPDETRASTLVFIGRNLPRRVFEDGLRYCVADTD